MNKLVNTYLVQSTLLIVLLTLISITYVWGAGVGVMAVTPLCITIVFQLLACLGYGLLWKYVASSSTASLPTFYMAASGMRMLAAVVVVLGFMFMVSDKQVIRLFVVTFLIYYIIILIYDTTYFVKVEKRIQKNG